MAELQQKCKKRSGLSLAHQVCRPGMCRIMTSEISPHLVGTVHELGSLKWAQPRGRWMLPTCGTKEMTQSCI